MNNSVAVDVVTLDSRHNEQQPQNNTAQRTDSQALAHSLQLISHGQRLLNANISIEYDGSQPPAAPRIFSLLTHSGVANV